MGGGPPRLPSHLSFKSALALLPTGAITPPIESVRCVHDAKFARWPPHINLIYPFLASPSESTSSGPVLKKEIQARINGVVQKTQPLIMELNADPCGVFHHSKRSKTVWLKPVIAGDAVHRLQAELQAEFAECDADDRPFTPHLSMGQAKSQTGAEALMTEVKKTVSEFTSQRTSGEEKLQSSALQWHIDTVFVIEREGFHDRFKIVGAVKLGGE
jgi:2'-5' RNA ligase